VAVGSELLHLAGYPFDVRYSDGAVERATAAADVAADAYVYFSRLFSAVEPDIAVVVADEADWPGVNNPYGMAFFRDDAREIRPGIVVMPAGAGDFWIAIAQDLRDASPSGYAKLLATYPDGAGGLDLQPFFDLITIHELGHAFEALGYLRLPTFWLSEIFANLAMHAYVATRLPASLPTLEVLSTVGAGSRKLAARMRADGYSTLEKLQAPPGVGRLVGPTPAPGRLGIAPSTLTRAARDIRRDNDAKPRPCRGPHSGTPRRPRLGTRLRSRQAPPESRRWRAQLG
jgi:hypothetical protein